MPGKKDEIDKAVEQMGPANVHPIGKLNPDGSMSLVIGGVEQWAKDTALKQSALYKELVAQGIDPTHAALMASWTNLPKEPGK